ncbi:MAG: RIP metalloprotease RseP [Gammaproteobacteria bacterium]|nr:RIP metalloprotease RseP [Gammaproteobacteria bacterium]
MEALQYLFFFLVTIAILVTVHEFGHYLAARASGVRILRFSVGFGRPLLSWTDRRGTAFTVAAIPLGGYLQMHGEDGDSGDWEADEASEYPNIPFDKLSPWWRIVIAAAGPGANFVLAFVVYWALGVAGATAYIPILGTVEEDTPAHLAGLRGGEELLAIDGRPTPTWREVNVALARRLGDTGDIEVSAKRPEQASARVYRIPVEQWSRGEEAPDPFASLGLLPLPAVIGRVLDDSAAERAGLRAWDRVLAVDGNVVETWDDWVEAVRAAPERALSLRVDRGGREVDVWLTPSAESVGEESIGFAGVEAPVRTVRHSVVEAIAWGANETAANTMLTLNILGKMFAGMVSPKTLSGPVRIAKIAKDSAQTGWRNFLNILALLSISLGVINLLPIPILDGGHILFACAQIVARRPVPPQVQAIGMRIGLFLVGFTMLFVIYNDVVQLL